MQQKATDSFRQWLSRISWKTLREHLHFELAESEQALFQDMVRLQAPPPTPIHPRAIPYASKCQAEASDGRDPIAQRRKNIRYRQRWFRFVQGDDGRLYILAKNFEGDASTRCLNRLTVGCTKEQIDCDRALEDGTVALLGKGGRISYRFRGRSRREEVHDDTLRKRAFLRMIKVASRGHFASVTPQSKRLWLDESQRWWFPLSMYLACRFEMSLWDAWHNNVRKVPAVPRIPNSQIKDTSAEFLSATQIKALSAGFVSATISLEIGRALKEIALHKVDPTRILDSLLWRLLAFTRTTSNANVKAPTILSVLESLQMIALEDMVDASFVQLKRSVSENVHEHLAEKVAALAAESLLQELADSELKPAIDRYVNKTKPRKKKHQRVASGQRAASIHQLEGLRTDSLVTGVGHVDTKDSIDLGMHQHCGETSSRKHNRNKVFILSILDELIECLFLNMEISATPTPQSASICALQTCGRKQLVSTPCSDGQLGSQLLIASPSEDSPSQPITPSQAPLSLGILQPPALSFVTNAELREAATRGKRSTPLVSGSETSELFNSNESSTQRIEMHHPDPDVIIKKDQSDNSLTLCDETKNNGMVWEVSDALVGDWGRVQGFASREQSIFKEMFPTDDTFASVSLHEVESARTNAPFARPQKDHTRAKGLDPCERANYRSTAYQGAQSIPGFDVVKLHLTAGVPKSSPDSTVPDTNATNVMGAPPALTSQPLSISGADIVAPAANSTVPLDLETPTLLADSSSEIAINLFQSPSYLLAATSPSKSTDDHDMQRQRRSTDALSSYRFVLVKSGTAKAKDDTDIRATLTLRQRSNGIRPPGTPTSHHLAAYSSSKHDASITGSTSSVRPMSHVNCDHSRDIQDLCARSETLEFVTEMDHWIDRRSTTFDAEEDNESDNKGAKDETTTITSAASHHEPEEMTRLREERNAYRDLCLTLGAEVSKLTNLLASQRVSSVASIPTTRGPYQPNLAEPVFDPESVAHGFLSTRCRTLAAMSDAGFRAEHESLASEDTGAIVRIGPGKAGSDWSVDQASAAIHSMQFQLPTFVNRSRGFSEPLSRTGMQSRLAQDVWQFVDATHSQLRKQNAMRQSAVEKMVRLVNTLWPRAQVKLYGSHVTGVCLPSSDVDFIICLPAVHKKAVAVAPGVLEGRNAINESSQKLLYRKLKAEPWIEQRSVKLIERTLVPVIKLTTKEVRGRALQLDITFDAPGHHGLEAVDLVGQVIEEMPTIRPIVLVLKQFLLTKSLLTAYTGGLSSYCLFLMVTRYLQEQPSAYGDVGALLIGFLDFFGNHFDPRTTGISVRRREYFPRPSYSASRVQPRPQPTTQTPPLWQTASHTSQGNGTTQFYRRNSFSDKGNAEAIGHGQLPTVARPHQLHHGLPRHSHAHQIYLQEGRPTDNSPFEHRISYSFDPLWVEDPLNESNNVGRNAFRYLQVQRAFSDAHRALVAALEWELPTSTDLESESDYPLLKCLLQSEDMVFDL